jgi:HAE1 family hydrophobic/amphiphilic exporter-1
VWSVGAGSELYQGLGAVVLGGMVVSTIFTLILIPAGFSLVMDARMQLTRLIGAVRGRPTGSAGGSGAASEGA